MRRIQQAIYQLLICIGTAVRQEVIHFLRRESGTRGRHLKAVLGTGYLLNELAFGAVTGYERRAGITSFESGLLLIEPQPIHLLGGAMASVAILMKNGFDVAQKLHGCLDRRWQRRRIL